MWCAAADGARRGPVIRSSTSKGDVSMADELRLMTVHAHPDDESVTGAATVAKYVAEGVDVLIVTCTGGERGRILNPALQGDTALAARLAEVRREELAEAVRVLGTRHEFLGFVDSGYPEDATLAQPEGCFAALPIETAAAPLVRLVRQFRPHVMITYDDGGGYSRHPDHVMANRITRTAFDHAADPHIHPDLDPPWRPLKLYYHRSFRRDRFQALDRALRERGLRSPYRRLLESWRAAAEPRITSTVECAEYFGTRNLAIRAHATQIDPRFWFAPPLDLEQQVWPTEHFELVRSAVTTEIPEDDLFAGVRAYPGIDEPVEAGRHRG
jgi:mycothiol S-conjugate amidase